MKEYTITEDHLERARTSFKGVDKDPNSIFGKAAELRILEDTGDVELLDNFAPWDFIKNGQYYDVKTRCFQDDGTLASTFTIAKTEVPAWPKALKEGKDTKLLLCEQTGEMTFRYVGSTMYSKLVAHNKIEDSFKEPGTQYFYAWYE